MSEKNTRIRTRFGPDTSFELSPVTVAPFRALFEDRFEGLKTRLLDESLNRSWEPKLNSKIRRAANEAATLARLTQYPFLVFPVLFEEKRDEVLRLSPGNEATGQRTREFIAL